MVPLGDSHTVEKVSILLCLRERGETAQLTLLQLELLDTLLIGGDGRALDTNRVLLNSFGSIDCDLIVGLISVFKALVVKSDADQR